MLSIQSHIPTTLAPFIKSFWHLKVSERLEQSYVEEILPDGHHEIIFHVNASPVCKRSDNENWQTDSPVFFAGQNKKKLSAKAIAGRHDVCYPVSAAYTVAVE